MSPLLRPAEVTRLLHAESRWLEQARARIRRTRLSRSASQPALSPRRTDPGESR